MLLLLQKTVLVFEQLLAFWEWPAPPNCQPTFLCPFWRAQSVQFAHSISCFLVVEYIYIYIYWQQVWGEKPSRHRGWLPSRGAHLGAWHELPVSQQASGAASQCGAWSPFALPPSATREASLFTDAPKFLLPTFQQKIVMFNHLEQAAFGVWSRTCQFNVFIVILMHRIRILRRIWWKLLRPRSINGSLRQGYRFCDSKQVLRVPLSMHCGVSKCEAILQVTMVKCRCWSWCAEFFECHQPKDSTHLAIAQRTLCTHSPADLDLENATFFDSYRLKWGEPSAVVCDLWRQGWKMTGGRVLRWQQGHFQASSWAFFFFLRVFFDICRWQAAWNHAVPCSARLEASKGCKRRLWIAAAEVIQLQHLMIFCKCVPQWQLAKGLVCAIAETWWTTRHVTTQVSGRTYLAVTLQVWRGKACQSKWRRGSLAKASKDSDLMGSDWSREDAGEQTLDFMNIAWLM